MAKKKGFFGSTFQFSRWMGMAEIKNNASAIKGLFNSITDKEKPEFSETFEEAVTRLELSETEITQRTLNFLKLTWIYLFFACCVLAYAVYLYSIGDSLGMFMCFPVISVLCSFAFKEHFWYTQLKHRRLGMSAKDWFECLFRSSK